MAAVVLLAVGVAVVVAVVVDQPSNELAVTTSAPATDVGAPVPTPNSVTPSPTTAPPTTPAPPTTTVPPPPAAAVTAPPPVTAAVLVASDDEFMAQVERCRQEERMIFAGLQARINTTGSWPDGPDGLVPGFLEPHPDGWSARWSFHFEDWTVSVVPTPGGSCDI